MSLVTNHCTMTIASGVAMHNLGASLAHVLEQRMCEQRISDSGITVQLRGPLGAGKTTLCQGVLAAMGYTGRVKSPTYTLVESYDLAAVATFGPLKTVHHFDFYRIVDPEELELIGIGDYFTAGSLCLMEWPEQAGCYLPVPDLRLQIRIPQDQPEHRQLNLAADTVLGKAWLSLVSTDLSGTDFAVNIQN